jgi:hypothetical protein
MGIHNLHKLLRGNIPDIYKEIHLSKYSFKKVAIDISLYMCKYKVCFGNNWLTAFINLIATLRRNEIHCVFIYDSGSPEEKTKEKEYRQDKKRVLENKIKNISDGLDIFYQSNEINENLKDFYNKRLSKKLPSFLKSTDTININVIETELEKIKSQVINITKEDFLLTKKLFTILKVPFFDAPLEAETTCSDLCKRGIVDAVYQKIQMS